MLMWYLVAQVHQCGILDDKTRYKALKWWGVINSPPLLFYALRNDLNGLIRHDDE